MNLKAELHERSEKHYLEFRLSEGALLGAVIPPEFLVDGCQWSFHSDGDGAVVITRRRSEQWTATGDGTWQKKDEAETELQMVPSKQEVLDMIAAMTEREANK